MFKHLTNIETAFRHIRAFSLIIVALCVALTAFSIWTAQQTISRERQRIYILSNGKAMEAIGDSRSENFLVEARDHIRTFHRLFFTLDPDDLVIQKNVASALNLADESAKRQYDNLREKGYYANVISANISQRIEVDSIAVDMDAEPYQFRCYATQTLTRATSTMNRQLVTQGQLRLVTRSDNNPHGLLVQQWEIIQN